MEKQLTPHQLSLYWLEKIVINLNLCPFAKIPYEKGLVRLVENESNLESDQLSFFLDELQKIQETPASELSTTLIAFINNEDDFYDFNDFAGLCEEMLIESGLEEHFQIVVFHPEYIFDEEDADERVHFVGRSPFPTIHLLRNAEIEMALEKYSELETISAFNEKKLLAMTMNDLKKLFYYLD